MNTNIIFGEIREVISPNRAKVRVKSYGINNNFNFENMDILEIKFTNVNNEKSIDGLLNKTIEIAIFEKPTDLKQSINGKGRVMQIIENDIFYTDY
jgi:hypothetical protein